MDQGHDMMSGEELCNRILNMGGVMTIPEYQQSILESRDSIIRGEQTTTDALFKKLSDFEESLQREDHPGYSERDTQEWEAWCDFIRGEVYEKMQEKDQAKEFFSKARDAYQQIMPIQESADSTDIRGICDAIQKRIDSL